MATTGADDHALSDHIAAFVAGFDLNDAPSELIGIAETAFVDTIGVMLAGSCEPACDIVCDMVSAEGASPTATVVGRSLRTSPQNAAFANGTATQALDFDLSFMSGQSAAAIIPALLPLAETLDATAEEVIAAYIVGSEVCARIVRCFPTMSSGAGWHGAGIVGAMAASVAAARLMRVPADAIPAIVGIAASSASGLGESYGTMTKPLQVGMAARNGLMAAQLGRAGFSASPTGIEGAKGFLASYARGFAWDTAPFDDLGEIFNLLDPAYKIKPFSCGGLLHTAIEAALDLRGDALPHLDQIHSIVVGATKHAAGRVKKHFPDNEDAARFSLKFVIPYTLIHGAPTLATFTEVALEDSAVRALSECVSAFVDESFEDVSVTGHSPSRVTINFDDGEVLEKVVYHASGSKEAPMSEAVIRAKFHDCASQVVSKSDASALYECLRNFRDQGSLRDLWPMLVPKER